MELPPKLLLLALGLFASTAFGQINSAGLDKATTKLITDAAFQCAQSIGKGDFEEALKACDYPFYYDGLVLKTADALKQRLAKQKLRQQINFDKESTAFVDNYSPQKIEGFSWENIAIVAVPAQANTENFKTLRVLIRVDPKNSGSLRVVGFD